MKRLLSLLLVSVLLSGWTARAQMAVRPDSTAVSAFQARELIAPGALIATGIGIHCFAHDAIDVPVNRWFQEQWRAGRPERTFDNYIQYVPIVMDVGLGLVGVPAISLSWRIMLLRLSGQRPTARGSSMARQT